LEKSDGFIVNRGCFKNWILNMLLMLGSMLVVFVLIETAYRIFDPFPYITGLAINSTEHGNLSMYDEMLGWKGVPDGNAEFITENNKVTISHNSYGFRDIDHRSVVDKKPAVVFLGDSFTWGFEVEFEDMFVNRLRTMLPSFELFNLAHRGYGTDQSLLTFRAWHREQPLKLVILMFSENDVADNNSDVRYDKSKPKFVLKNDRLSLEGVPVPKDDGWKESRDEVGYKASWRELFSEYRFHSHFLRDVKFRLNVLRWRNKKIVAPMEKEIDYTLTYAILQELQREVRLRGAKLIVAFIPSKREIENLTASKPYQKKVSGLCEQLDIHYLDMAPAFRHSWLRSYYRKGMHWNDRGHKLAAGVLVPFIKKELDY